MNPLIESNPGVMMGKPVRGTRITVEVILEKLAAGAAIEQVLQEHPRLTREAAFAAIEFRSSAKGGRHLSIVCRMMLSRGQCMEHGKVSVLQ